MDKLHLAVVEDSPHVMGFLKAYLPATFPQVEHHFYGNGAALMRDIETGIHFKVVIMDGTLPDGPTGPQYTKATMQALPDAFVIGYSGEKDMERLFLAYGAKAFVLKATDNNILKDAIQSGLG